MIKKLLAAIGMAVVGCSALAQYAAAPFKPSAVSSTNVAVTATAQSLALPATPTGSNLVQLILTCIGTQTCFIRTDGVTVTAANGIPLIGNSQVLVSIDSTTAALSVIAASTGSTLYATAGLGF